MEVFPVSNLNYRRPWDIISRIKVQEQSAVMCTVHALCRAIGSTPSVFSWLEARGTPRVHMEMRGITKIPLSYIISECVGVRQQLF